MAQPRLSIVSVLIGVAELFNREDLVCMVSVFGRRSRYEETLPLKNHQPQVR